MWECTLESSLHNFSKNVWKHSLSYDNQPMPVTLKFMLSTKWTNENIIMSILSVNIEASTQKYHISSNTSLQKRLAHKHVLTVEKYFYVHNHMSYCINNIFMFTTLCHTFFFNIQVAVLESGFNMVDIASIPPKLI